MNATQTANEILNELNEIGAGLGIFSPIPITWAAEKVAKRLDAESVKAGIKIINRKRDRLALPPVFFEYGHELF